MIGSLGGTSRWRWGRGVIEEALGPWLDGGGSRLRDNDGDYGDWWGLRPPSDILFTVPDFVEGVVLILQREKSI